VRPLVTTAEMRAIEQSFVEAGGDLDSLMRQAGMEVASRVPAGKPVLILAGPGNNGGDALIAATILRERGEPVRVYTYKRAPSDDSSVVRTEDDGDLAALSAELERCDVVVDGLLGTGRRRPVADRLAAIIDRANDASAFRVAVDLPTGVDADTGDVETVALRAGLTVTLGFGKRGLWGSPGADFAGSIEIADIGLPPGIAGPPSCELLDAGDIRPLLPTRAREWNKGKSGRVLVVSGCADFSGAPTLVATASYRAGAGLVDLAVPASIRTIVATHAVETIFTATGADDFFSPDSVAAVAEAATKANAVALGPGLGGDGETFDFVRRLLPHLKEANVPVVLDADGLNAVAGSPNWWEHVPAQTVVTPHPGEMGRLLGLSTGQVQADRFSAAAGAAEAWKVVVVLKGSDTVIAAPGQALRVCPLGGPNLGTGGTGDVLAGIIASYLAQASENRSGSASPFDAATAGVWVHAEAGDLARSELGQAGTMASDLWALIPKVRRNLLEPLGLD